MRKKRGKEIYRIEWHKPKGCNIIVAILMLFILIPLTFHITVSFLRFSNGNLFSFILTILILLFLVIVLLLSFGDGLKIYENGVLLQKFGFIYKKFIPFDQIDDAKLIKETRGYGIRTYTAWILSIITKDQKTYESLYDTYLRKKKKLEEALKLILKYKIP